MSVVHYKFRSSLEYDSVTFDGLSISLGDLKEAISLQKKLGKNSSTDFILQVTNAQTKEEYADESAQIPKNSSVIVRRIPLANAQPKNKTQLGAEKADMYSSGLPKPVEMRDSTISGAMSSSRFGRGASITSSAGSEEDKIKAMINQVGEEWNPSKYTYSRGRGFAPTGPLPPSYICYRCGQPGHYIRNCPTNVGNDTKFEPRIKRSTGIPKTWIGDEFVGVDDSKVHSSEHLPSISIVKTVPEELKCPMCKKLLTDAVLIPCCGTSYCDDCIRNYLLDNDQVCPECGSENASPDNLVLNKQLRQAVKSFNTGGTAAGQPVSSAAIVSKTTKITPPGLDIPKKEVIKSEADSTKSNETTATKEVATAEAEKNSVTVSATSSTTVSAPTSAHSQGVDTTGGISKPASPFKGDQTQHPPTSRVEVSTHHIRPRMPVVPHMVVPSHQVQPIARPHMPIQKGLAASMPYYMPPNPSRPVMTSVPLDYLPARLKPVQPIQPPFPPVHLHSRPPGYNSPAHDLMSGFRSNVNVGSAPLSEEEFYRTQRRLKVSRSSDKKRKPTKRKPEHENHLPTLRHGDFDDELSQYKALQKSRRKERSRTPSWSSDSSRSPDRKSGSFSSFGPSRSPTPEGWDRSRSPTPSPELIKQKRLLKDSKRNREKSPKHTRKIGDSGEEVHAKKRRMDKSIAMSNSSKPLCGGNESTNLKKRTSNEKKKRVKESSGSKREGDISSSKKRSKKLTLNKDEPKKEKTETSKDKNSKDKTQTVTGSDTVELKKRDSSKKKLKKKHKHKEKKAKGKKRVGESQETESEITTQDDDDDDDFDIVQDKKTILDIKESNINEKTLHNETEENTNIHEKVEKPRTSPKKELIEPEEDRSIHIDEDDFDIVQDKQVIENSNEMCFQEDKEDNKKTQELENCAEMEKENDVQGDDNDDDDFELVYQRGTSENNEDDTERSFTFNIEETGTDIVSDVCNVNEGMNVSNGTKECFNEDNVEKMENVDENISKQGVEDELVLNTSDSLDRSTENMDLNFDRDDDEDEHKDMELEISVFVGKEGRRDSLLDELQSEEENESEKGEGRQETEEGTLETKHKKHKKKEKKHKHKKHKKKHKHKKSKKHKKDKTEEATNAADSQTTQSDSFDEEEEEFPSEDSEMEEVFKGPRSVIVPASTVQSD